MMAVSNDLMEAVARHPGLKELKIGGPTLASSPPGLSSLSSLILLNNPDSRPKITNRSSKNLSQLLIIQ